MKTRIWSLLIGLFASLQLYGQCTTTADCSTNATCATPCEASQTCDEILFRVYWVRRGVGNGQGGNDPQLKLTYGSQTYDMGFSFATSANNTTTAEFFSSPTSCSGNSNNASCPSAWPLDLNIPCGAQSIDIDLEFFENDGPFCEDFGHPNGNSDSFHQFMNGLTIDLSDVYTSWTTGFDANPNIATSTNVWVFGSDPTYSFAYEFFCNSCADSCDSIPPPPMEPEIPTMDQWTLFILGLLLCVMAVVGINRKRTNNTIGGIKDL